jgi:hypothetical protein
MMAAEELGIPVDKVRAIMADTHSLGYNRVTAGSRTTYSTGMIIVDSARKAIKELCKRAAGIWGVPEEGVTFEDGYCRPASSNVGTFEPLSIAQIAAKTMASHGAIAGHSEMSVTGAGPGFGLHIVDVEVDRETGRVDIKRYTVVEDAGPGLGEQHLRLQGQPVQGIGQAAIEQGRSVYAVPGHINAPTAHGSNRLIQQGAKLVMDASDILDDLQILLPEKEKIPITTGRALPELSTNERRVYDAINPTETPIDQIASKCDLPSATVSSTLLALELKRLVKQLPGKYFVRLS